MSITKVPAVGLQIDMEEYIRLRLSSNGPDFWYPSNQEVLCKMLAPFLPRMSYDVMTNKVTASIVENGRELLSQSEDCAATPIPVKQFEMFNNLLKGLRSKMESEVVDPDTKSLIKGFKLPDPDKAPEMYRIYGDKHNPRLAILWGMEKVVDSSISVVDMNVAETLKHHTEKTFGKKKWIAILLALAAGGLIWAAVQSDDNSKPVAGEPSSSGSSGDSSVPDTPAPGSPGGSSTPGVPAPKPGETVIPDARAIDEIIDAAVWQIVVKKGDKTLSTATAFCFDPAGRFITNHHVAKLFNETGVKYFLKNDTTVIEVKECPYMDENRDLAILKVEAPKEALPYLRLQKEVKPERGEVIYVEGYPEGIAKLISQGIVSGLVTLPDTQLTYVLHSAPVSPGSSGSPVVNRKGEVVAVVIGNIPGSTNQAQSLNHAMWIGELDQQYAQQPADIEPIIVPPNVAPAPVNENGEIVGPNPDPEKNADPSQNVPIIGVEGMPVTTSPIAPINESGTPTDSTTSSDDPISESGTPTDSTTSSDGPADESGTPTDSTTSSDGPADESGTPTDSSTSSDGPADEPCTPTDSSTSSDGPADESCTPTGSTTPSDGPADESCTPTDSTTSSDGPADESCTPTGSATPSDGPVSEPCTPTGSATPTGISGTGNPQPVEVVDGTTSVVSDPVAITTAPVQPRPETLMDVSEDRPFSLTKVGQKTLDNGKIDIELQFNPAPGTKITSASVNEVPMNSKTRRVTIRVEEKSQKVPVKVNVQGRKDPYSVDCTINPVKR